MSMDVASIGTEIALPFVYAACRRYGLPYDVESGGAMIWWAGYESGSIRAMMGWADYEPHTLAVFGPFGDGSQTEDMWMTHLLRSMDFARGTIVIVPASPSLYIRLQSAQLERYGECRREPVPLEPNGTRIEDELL
jgi:hypothetical protein